MQRQDSSKLAPPDAHFGAKCPTTPGGPSSEAPPSDESRSRLPATPAAERAPWRSQARGQSSGIGRITVSRRASPIDVGRRNVLNDLMFPGKRQSRSSDRGRRPPALSKIAENKRTPSPNRAPATRFGPKFAKAELVSTRPNVSSARSKADLERPWTCFTPPHVTSVLQACIGARAAGFGRPTLSMAGAC